MLCSLPPKSRNVPLIMKASPFSRSPRDAASCSSAACVGTPPGLGGRPRRLGDDAERARKTVGARIRDALRRIETVHPALAAHLATHVQTGTYCRYSRSPRHEP